MKNIHATHEWTKNFFNENQPCYERLETLVTQKPIIGGEDDFASTDCLWEDTSLRLKDGDVITFHITDVANGGEDYVSVPLYCDNSISSWGTEGFDTNLGDAWFGYNGIIDENNLYIGVRLVIPQWFNGTVEIGRTVVKQLDDKFIPDTVTRNADLAQQISETKRYADSRFIEIIKPEKSQNVPFMPYESTCFTLRDDIDPTKEEIDKYRPLELGLVGYMDITINGVTETVKFEFSKDIDNISVEAHGYYFGIWPYTHFVWDSVTETEQCFIESVVLANDEDVNGTASFSYENQIALDEIHIPDTIARKADIPIYKGDGEYSATVGTENEALGIASFVAGKGNKVTDKYGVALGRATQAGYAALAEGMENIADDYAHAEGRETHAKGRFSHTQGYQTEAVGEASHAQGYRTTAKANYTHTEGKETTATSSAAHAQGANTEANGVVSHAQGQSSIADGDCSHAQGHTTKAVGFCSHSQGRLTEAIGENSDACGYKTIAKGKNSHTGGESCVTEEDATNAFVEGFNNTNRAPRAFIAGGQWNSTSNNAEDSFVYGIGSSASAVAQKVGGKFPITDTKYAEIVGNGKSSSARSNAYTLDWDGNACFSGSVECNGIIMKSPNGTRYKITVSDSGTLTTSKV